MTHPTPAPDALPPTAPAVATAAARLRVLCQALHDEVLDVVDANEGDPKTCAWGDGVDYAVARVRDTTNALLAAVEADAALANSHAAGYRAALDDLAAEVAQMGGGR